MSERDSERGFKIEDKRRFTESGEPRDPEAPTEEKDPEREVFAEAGAGKCDNLGSGATESPDPAGLQARSGESGLMGEDDTVGPAGQRPPGMEGGYPAVDFSGFVVGLAQQAFMLLGAAPDPVGGEVLKDLPQAAAMIDIIAMLERKTAGNLTEDESRLVEEVLYELRMRYVAESGSGGRASGDTN